MCDKVPELVMPAYTMLFGFADGVAVVIVAIYLMEVSQMANRIESAG